MTKERRKAIEKLATKIREITQAVTPVNFYSIVEMLGGEITESDFRDDDIAGKVEKHGDSFRITLNSNQSDLRNNFTVAHELGHLFLHMGYIIDRNKWNSIRDYIDSAKYRLGYSEEEYEANQFSASFLMPEDEYRDFINNNKIDNRINIKELSNYFNVSNDAALTRGKWLEIFSWEN